MQKSEIYEILEDQYFGGSPHEERELAGLPKIIPSNIATVIDVGASLGQYTKAIAQILEAGKIVSLEADPVRFERLQDHCDTWKQEYNVNIVAVHGAAFDKSGSAAFFTTESNVSGAINEIAERSSNWKEIDVPAYTLDELTTTKDNTFVKMDIEGGEYGAMLGAPQLLAGEGNVFLMELHVWGDQKRNKTVSDVLRIFRRHNYVVSRYFGHYLFRGGEHPNTARYAAIAMSFRVKRLIYFSPFRSLAMRLKKSLKRLFRAAS